MRSKWLTMMLVMVLCMVTGCTKKPVETDQQDPSLSQVQESDGSKYVMKAYVQEVNDSYMLVVPFEDNGNSSNLLHIELQELTDDCLPSVGDVYHITYDGMIEETFPAGLSKIYDIKCTDQSKLHDIDHIRVIQEETYYALYEIDINALTTVFEKYEWIEGTTDYISEYELMINGVKYIYHKDSGTFIDMNNKMCMTLSSEDREYVNDLITQFTNTRHWSSGPAVMIDIDKDLA